MAIEERLEVPSIKREAAETKHGRITQDKRYATPTFCWAIASKILRRKIELNNHDMSNFGKMTPSFPWLKWGFNSG